MVHEYKDAFEWSYRDLKDILAHLADHKIDSNKMYDLVARPNMEWMQIMPRLVRKIQMNS